MMSNLFWIVNVRKRNEIRMCGIGEHRSKRGEREKKLFNVTATTSRAFFSLYVSFTFPVNVSHHSLGIESVLYATRLAS